MVLSWGVCALITMVKVEPWQIHQYWEEVAPDLDECRVHDKESVWLEDIYFAIKAGHAVLHVAIDSAQGYAGMMVTTLHTDQWEPSQRFLHVWYLNTRAGHESLIKHGSDYLDGFAKEHGASLITFRADRLAFERWAKPLGFECGEIELRKQVNG